MKFPRYLRPLRSRNYRLYFTGQLISLVGTWMTQAATLWLVYHLSNSLFYLGAAGFASLLPSFLLSPLAGVGVDRVNRHRLLMVTQVLSMLQSFALAAFTLTGAITVPLILTLNAVQGAINAFDVPTRQALVVDFITNREELGSAIALNSTMFNLARLAGPAIGGFVIAAFGAGACFLIDGSSYLPVLACLLLMRLPVHPPAAPPRHPLVELREGIAAAFGFAPIRIIIVTVAVLGFAGFSYSVLTPMFARDVFGGDARTLGWLLAATGFGALLGAVYLGSRASVLELGKVMRTGCVLLGLGLVGFALSRWLPPALVCLGAAGMGGVMLTASGNTLVQSLIEDSQRGRVISLYTMAFSGSVPLGNLLVGAVSSHIGAPLTLAICGCVCLAAAWRFHAQLPRMWVEVTAALNRKALAHAGSAA